MGEDGEVAPGGQRHRSAAAERTAGEYGMAGEGQGRARRDAQLVEGVPQVADGRRLGRVGEAQVPVVGEFGTQRTEALDARGTSEADLVGAGARDARVVASGWQLGCVPVAGRLPLKIALPAGPVDRADRSGIR